ncbi:hypothetical protein [Achromobacter anxifer]|uniref:8-oxoguanine DNA glycosylase OGG fold protein n=1 Tax=Achromobacter anxifer TaxID=1287737 RepID=UPI003B8A645E
MQTRYEDQGTYNPVSPRSWSLDVLGEARPELPSTPLTRAALRSYCTSEADVLDCYLAVMAWGGQNAGPTGRARTLNTWRHGQALIRDRLETLRRERPNRTDAFGLFCGRNRVPGLGVAFFTKLLYFFAPQSAAGADRYILDQWTAKSVNLLAGKRVISMSRADAKRKTSECVTRFNTPAVYEAYCTELETLAVILNCSHADTPLRVEDIELMLFSSAGPGTAMRPWRQHVRSEWTKAVFEGRFRRDLVLDRARSLRTLLNAEPLPSTLLSTSGSTPEHGRLV